MLKKRVLLLDVMDTLVEDPFFTKVPEFFDESLDSLLKSMRYDVWCAFERGEIDEEEYRKDIFIDGRTFDLDALKETLRRGFRFMDGIEDLLLKLHESGVRIYAMSNYPIWYKIIDEKLALSRFLSWETVSCKTGLRKPKIAAYTNAAGIAAAEVSDCFFVDDRVANVEGAREAGMQAFLTTKKSNDLRREIRSFLAS